MNTQDPSAARRSDLDALRAGAMLLGIALHASLSFFPSFWMVTDSRVDPLFGVFFSAIHGFRMPLFFVMSGFFSAMLLSRRGGRALVGHRFKRVFLPMLLGMVTVVPLTNWISGLAMSKAAAEKLKAASPVEKRSDIWTAAAAGDLAAIERHLAAGAKVDAKGGSRDLSPVTEAALADQGEAIDLLVKRGADVNAPEADGATPLLAATFVGNEKAVAALIRNGADVNATNKRGETPLHHANVDEGATRYYASMLGLKLNEEGLGARKAAIAESLRSKGAVEGGGVGVVQLLMLIPLFSHLWFLWFLWWLVLGLAAVSAIGSRLPRVALPDWLVLSPVRYLWLVPLTMLPQWFMGAEAGGAIFGPDTSGGLLPIPHVFAYYSIFFGFGAIYYGAEDRSGWVGDHWWLPLSIGLFAVLPLGIALISGWTGPVGLGLDKTTLRVISVGLQAAYPWLLTFGLMGLVRKACPVESPRMRYLSDSAYWLYLAHLPLIVGAQYLVRDWPLPAVAKFTLMVVAVTAFLLWTYQVFVRYHWLGRFLNGPRARPVEAEQPVAVA